MGRRHRRRGSLLSTGFPVPVGRRVRRSRLWSRVLPVVQCGGGGDAGAYRKRRLLCVSRCVCIPQAQG